MNMNIEYLPAQSQGTSSFNESVRRKISLSSSAATMRVLSVMRHWITKHGQVRPEKIPAWVLEIEYRNRLDIVYFYRILMTQLV